MLNLTVAQTHDTSITGCLLVLVREFRCGSDCLLMLSQCWGHIWPQRPHITSYTVSYHISYHMIIYHITSYNITLNITFYWIKWVILRSILFIKVINLITFSLNIRMFKNKSQYLMYDNINTKYISYKYIVLKMFRYFNLGDNLGVCDLLWTLRVSNISLWAQMRPPETSITHTSPSELRLTLLRHSDLCVCVCVWGCFLCRCVLDIICDSSQNSGSVTFMWNYFQTVSRWRPLRNTRIWR